MITSLLAKEPSLIAREITDSATPLFWEERYQAGERPWEKYGIPEVFTDFLKATPRCGRVLLPGCGSAYEMKAFLEAGWDAWGIDFSETAVKRARELLPQYQDRILLGDFFTYSFEQPFPFIYERSFLCALPPRLRGAYAQRMKELLVPGGHLVGFFLEGEAFDGPPFPLHDLEEAKKLFGGFELIEHLAVKNSSSVSRAKEYWARWKKKSS